MCAASMSAVVPAVVVIARIAVIALAITDAFMIVLVGEAVITPKPPAIIVVAVGVIVVVLAAAILMVFVLPRARRHVHPNYLHRARTLRLR